MELKSVSAVVTGGASGLGRATAAHLVAAGGRVAILDRPGSPGADVARALGSAAVFTPADVTSGDEVEAALKTAHERLGAINVLVNCAGVATAARTVGRSGPARLDEFSLVIQINLIGTFNCIRLAAALMARNAPGADGERGVIINTASVAAFDGQIGQAAYSASKGGVVGMTLPIARDLASLGIRCCTIACAARLRTGISHKSAMSFDNCTKSFFVPFLPETQGISPSWDFKPDDIRGSGFL
jgi:NAD(P)-dependent dehydrogenase (short-subunit alcohol dehydrogenase family)